MTTVDETPLTDDQIAAVLDETPEPAPEPAPAAAAAAEPAPLGYTKSGKPRRRSAPGTGPRVRRKGTPQAPKARPAGASRPAPAPAVDLRAGATAMVNVIGMGLGLVAQQTQSPALQLDAMTVALNAPALADAITVAAEQLPPVAAVVAWFAQASPWGALVEAVQSVGLQIAANHGQVPAGILGTVSREELTARYLQATGQA